MNKGDKVLWKRAKPYSATPIEAQIVGESMARYQIKYQLSDHWVYTWAAKDRVMPVPKSA